MLATAQQLIGITAPVDLTFTTDEQAFADEARDVAGARTSTRRRPFESLEDEVAWGRAWQAELAAGRWVGIHWPHEFGGRGASPVRGRDLQHGVRPGRAPRSR